MPSYSSYITAVQALYAGLDPAAFPGDTLPPGPFLDETPTQGNPAVRLSPPYVLIRDLGGQPKWTFTGDQNNIPGQNAIVYGSFMIEAYATDLGDADKIIQAILWNGQIPNRRVGLAFATFSLTLPQKGMAGCVVPTKDQRNYTGLLFNNDRIHVTKQWFDIKTAISGDGQ